MDSKPSTIGKASAHPAGPSQFWADWDSSVCAPQLLRRDTRIYWEPQSSGAIGRCIGTFFGENPGGGRPAHGLNHNGYSPIEDRNGKSGDDTLRLILETWAASISTKASKPRSDDYIEVLNLYYFRNPKSGMAHAAWQNLNGASFYNPKISTSSEFVLLGWGGKLNATSEAAAAIQNIGNHSKAIIPNSSGVIALARGPLSFPLRSFPAAPSYFLQSPLVRRPKYVAAVAGLI